MYYFYRPSKSSICGHSLRKMHPSIQYNRINSLLSELDIVKVEEKFYLSLRHSLNNNSCNDDSDKVYKQICSILDFSELVTNPYQRLDESQFKKVIEYLFSIENELKQMSVYIDLSNVIKISNWKINNANEKTMSELDISYGSEPYIGTEFILNSEQEFDYLFGVFNKNGICKLNRKHLSPIKNKKFTL